MDYDDVQTVVARCLADPMYLEQARKGTEGAPADVTRAAVVLGSQVLERLALVRGMMTKVKHNALKQVVPHTMRLLDQLGLELAYFTWVSVPYVQRRSLGPISTPEFLDFSSEQLERFLTEKRVPEMDAVLDMLAHEALLWDLVNTEIVRLPLGGDHSLIWRGRLELRRFSTDVLALSDGLRQGVFNPAMTASVDLHTVGYWRPDHSDRAQAFEVQPHAAVIFSLVDGKRGPIEVAAQLKAHGFGELGPADLHTFLEDASKQGFLAYTAAS